MKCVIIPSEYTKEQNFFGADRVVASFKELEVGQLRAMVECDH